MELRFKRKSLFWAQNPHRPGRFLAVERKVTKILIPTKVVFAFALALLCFALITFRSVSFVLCSFHLLCVVVMFLLCCYILCFLCLVMICIVFDGDGVGNTE